MEPFHKGEAVFSKWFRCDPQRRIYVSAKADVDLRSFEHKSKSRMPTTKERWTVGIIFKKKIIHRMPFATRHTSQSGSTPRIDASLMRQHQRLPLPLG
jgi:hypothetical protein